MLKFVEDENGHIVGAVQVVDDEDVVVDNGMTIKEAGEIISEPLHMKNVPQEIIDAHRVAIECMRKCHEIEKIIHDTPYGGVATVRKIREVLKDGKTD